MFRLPYIRGLSSELSLHVSRPADVIAIRQLMPCLIDQADHINYARRFKADIPPSKYLGT